MHLLGLDKSVHILQRTLWVVVGILKLTVHGRVVQIVNWYIQSFSDASWTVLQVKIVPIFHLRKECTLLVCVV